MKPSDNYRLTDKTFKNLFEHYYVPLCTFAYQYVEDRDSANDIVQNCFVELWERRDKFSNLPAIKSFLYISIRNQSINELNHNKCVQDFADKMQRKSLESFFHEEIIVNETYRILSEAIEKLPKRMREIMELALDGKSNAEIASSLSISVENVHSLKKIAYVKLRPLLKDYYYLVIFLI